MVDVGKPATHCGSFDLHACVYSDTPVYVLHSAHLPSVTEELLCGRHWLGSPSLQNGPRFSFLHSNHRDRSCEHWKLECRPYNKGKSSTLRLTFISLANVIILWVYTVLFSARPQIRIRRGWKKPIWGRVVAVRAKVCQGHECSGATDSTSQSQRSLYDHRNGGRFGCKLYRESVSQPWN